MDRAEGRFLRTHPLSETFERSVLKLHGFEPAAGSPAERRALRSLGKTLDPDGAYHLSNDQRTIAAYGRLKEQTAPPEFPRIYVLPSGPQDKNPSPGPWSSLGGGWLGFQRLLETLSAAGSAAQPAAPSGRPGGRAQANASWRHPRQIEF